MSSDAQESKTQFSAFDIDLLGMAKRRWHLILLGLFMGIGASLVYQFSTTPIYEADIEILVGQRTVNSAQMTNHSPY